MNLIIPAFVVGMFIGGFFVAWADNARPTPPLAAFVCSAMGLEGGVNMDRELVCFEPGSTTLSDDLLGEFLERLQSGLERREGEG